MKIIFTLIFVAIFQYSYSQVNAAEQAVKRAERKVGDKILEKTFNGLVDKLFGSDSTEVTEDPSVKTDSTVTANSSPFGGLFSSKKVDKVYTFDITLDMVISTKDKKGKGDPLDMKMHYNKDSAYMASEVASSFNIMDFSSMKNYTVTGGNVTVMNLDKIIEKANKRSMKEEENEEEEVVFKETGRQETIAGYLCNEFTMESEDMMGHYWIAKDIGIKVETYQKTFAANPNVVFPKDAQGVVLRMTIEDKDRQTTTHMETKEVIKQDLSYDLSKYKVTDLGRLGF